MTRLVFAAWAVALFSLVAGCVGSFYQRAPQIPTLAGTYAGMYYCVDGYSTPTPITTSGEVTLVVDGEHYRVRGVERYAPPGGSGRIAMGPVIAFFDEGFHTCECDWSLIIRGSFTVVDDGSRLVLEQQNHDHDRLVRIVLEEASAAR